MNEQEKRLFNKIMNKIDHTPQKQIFKKFNTYIFSPITIKKLAFGCAISFLIGIFIGQSSLTNIETNSYSYPNYIYEIEEMEVN